MATSEELLNAMNTAVSALQNAQQTVVNGAAQLGNAAHRTGNENIAGTKTFSSSPVVPTPTAGDNSTKSASTAFVNTAIGTESNKCVHKTGNETLSGIKTFDTPPVLPTPSNVAPASMQAAPVSFVRDKLRAEIEAASGGRNTVVRDNDGNPHIMVVVPRFRVETIDASLGSGVHPAFVVNGVEKSEILIGKYLASQSSGGKVQTQPRQAPWVRVNHDQAVAACRALGTGFGVCSNAAWAARALWLYKELGDHVYYGNTNWGRNHAKTHQVGTMQTTAFGPGDTGNDTTNGAATLTGTGPDAWNDDGTPYGISDLVGNLWEWTPGLRLNEGEIQIIPDNDAMLASVDMSANSAAWKAILQAGTLVNPGTANTLKVEAPKTGDGSNVSVGTPTLATTIKNKLSGSNSANNSTITEFAAASGVTVPPLLKLLGIMPMGTTGVQGGIWTRNFGERLALRGGHWNNGAGCGPFALYLGNIRTISNWSLGFRSAFVS